MGALTDNRAPDPGDMSEYVAWVDLLLTAALQWPDWPDSPAGSRGFGYYHHYGDKGSIYIDAPNVDAIGVMLLGALGTGPIHAREAAAYSFQALPGEAVPEVVLGCLTRYVEQARRVPGWSGSEPESLALTLDWRAFHLLDGPEVPRGLSDADRNVFERHGAPGPATPGLGGSRE